MQLMHPRFCPLETLLLCAAEGSMPSISFAVEYTRGGTVELVRGAWDAATDAYSMWGLLMTVFDPELQGSASPNAWATVHGLRCERATAPPGYVGCSIDDDPIGGDCRFCVARTRERFDATRLPTWERLQEMYRVAG